MIRKIKLNVNGMHCTSCETIIKDSLEENGAAQVLASSKTGTVIVTYDDAKISEDKICALIKQEGYKL